MSLVQGLVAHDNGKSVKSCCCVGKMLGLDFFQSDRFRLRVLFTTDPSRAEDRDWQGSLPAAGRHQSRTVCVRWGEGVGGSWVQ